MNINLIILGAQRTDKPTKISEDYKGWNNFRQASYYVLKELLSEYQNMKIFCLDGNYPSHVNNNKIQYMKQYYNVEETKYFDIDSHNIIIEFCNLLDEYWCLSKTNYHKYDNKLSEQGYKIINVLKRYKNKETRKTKQNRNKTRKNKI
jgi:hypothetical protein